MKLISWNVNGIRAVVGRTFLQQFADMDADIFCLQETKAQDVQVAEVLSSLSGYHVHSNSAEKKDTQVSLSSPKRANIHHQRYRYH